MTFHRPSPRPAKQMDGYTPRPREIVLRRDPPATMCVPLPKAKPWRCEAYLRIVASYPCAHCGIEGRSQAAHSDEGKGLGIKSDDRGCFALCADQPGRKGCHSIFGATGMLPQYHRRLLETKYAAATRARIKADRLWRPEWPEFTEEQNA